MADYITTYTGKHFYPLNPNPEALCIEDFAHSLSMLCRGNGHVSCFYSVGEHCVNCALEAEARGYSARVILGCLLHDASESYMSDVPTPFKKFLKDYEELEDRLLTCIYQKFLGSDLTREEKSRVKEIDRDVLAYDLFYLLKEGKKEELPKLERPYSYGEAQSRRAETLYLEICQKYSGKL